MMILMKLKHAALTTSVAAVLTSQILLTPRFIENIQVNLVNGNSDQFNVSKELHTGRVVLLNNRTKLRVF